MDEEYGALIDAALGEKSDVIISNGKPENVRYLLTKFLENANKSVFIYSPQLSLFAKKNGKKSHFMPMRSC